MRRRRREPAADGTVAGVREAVHRWGWSARLAHDAGRDDTVVAGFHSVRARVDGLPEPDRSELLADLAWTATLFGHVPDRCRCRDCDPADTTVVDIGDPR